MDFLNRNANNQPQGARGAQGSAGGADNAKKAGRREPRWLRVIFVTLLFSVTVLAIAIAFLLYFGKDRENSYVDTTKQQAVFLTNGQVYFGRITRINHQYVDLQGIYYLNSQQAEGEATTTTQKQQNFSLVKLGCELHGPIDQMIINRDQISFWENLKSDGKVAKAIEQWVSQNPDGQTCDNSTNTNSTQQSTGTTENSAQ